MQAHDVMTTNVITVQPDTTVQAIAKRMIENRISAVPVLERDGRLVGIVSEGDLMRRSESGTESHPSWWLLLLESPEEMIHKYVKAHGKYAADVMTRRVVTVSGNTPVEEIAETLEKHHIKRVPVMNGDKLVGIVSRANLLRGLASLQTKSTPVTDDRKIKASIEAAFLEAGLRSSFLNVVVSGGVANLWGLAESDEEKNAARVAAETAPGVKDVHNNIGVIPSTVGAAMWSE